MNDDFRPFDPAETLRGAYSGYVETVRELALGGGLTLRALDRIREDLRPGGCWSPDAVPQGWKEQRVILLHDVASEMARLRGDGYTTYYAGAGDLLPSTPDFPPSD